jgi:hypothetical protein
MRATLITRVRTSTPLPTRLRGGAGWHSRSADTLSILDEGFGTVRQFSLGPDVPGMCGVSPELTKVAVSGRDRISVVDDRGAVLWSVSHTPWGTGYSYAGACGFSPDGRQVWATVPDTELGTEVEDGLWDDDLDADEPSAAGGWGRAQSWGDQWWVLDAATGTILGRGWLGAEATASTVLAHPDGVHMGLDLGEGQDGSRIYWGSRPHGRLLAATTGDTTRALADIHPGGKTYLTTARDSDGLMLHDFASHAMLAHRPDAELLGPGECMAIGAYLDDTQILVETIDKDWRTVRLLVLTADDLEILGDVRYPAPAGPSTSSGRDGTWVTREDGALSRWRLDTP